jgi:hypothetical protein
MGFRFKRFDYVGGVSPMSGLPWRDSPSDATARAQAQCKDFADFIIGCGKGWSLDTSRNVTTSSFVSVPIWNSSKIVNPAVAPGLFFINSNGCKLFMCVTQATSDYGIALEKENFALDFIDSGVIQQLGGTIFAMIPAGSSSSFGSSFDSSFLPSDATLLRGTVNTRYGNAAWWFTPACYAATNCTYSYGLFVDSYCVGISGSYTRPDAILETLIPGFFLGRIIGTLAHEESANQSSKYGSLSFSYPIFDTYDREFVAKPIIDETNNQFDRYGCLFRNEINYSETTSDPWRALFNNYGSITKADGTRLTASAGNIRFMSNVLDIMDSKVTSLVQSGSTRWVPYEVAVCTNNLSTYGIVTGDGFKGYLDTDLFRCGLVTLNQLYNNGTFCGWNNMLMIGWDSSNTDSL